MAIRSKALWVAVAPVAILWALSYIAPRQLYVRTAFVRLTDGREVSVSDPVVEHFVPRGDKTTAQESWTWLASSGGGLQFSRLKDVSPLTDNYEFGEFFRFPPGRFIEENGAPIPIREASYGPAQRMQSAEPTEWWQLGFVATRSDANRPVRRQTSARTRTLTSVRVPYWALAAIAGTFGWVRIRRQQRPLRAAGLCLACGYDLRASTDRCPECGQPTRAANTPTTSREN